MQEEKLTKHSGEKNISDLSDKYKSVQSYIIQNNSSSYGTQKNKTEDLASSHSQSIGILSADKNSSTLKSNASGVEIIDDDHDGDDLHQSKEEQLQIKFNLEKSMIDMKYKQ